MDHKISQQDLNQFLNQFATLLKGGVPIIDSLETLEFAQQKQKLRILIYSMKRDLQAGNSVYKTFKNYPHQFNELCCQLVNLGENTGKLATIIFSIASYQNRISIMMHKFKQAVIYPIFILIIALMVFIGLLIFVVPKFSEIFASSQVAIPFVTKIIFIAAENLQMLFYAGMLVSGLCVFAFKYYLYNLPIIKTFHQKFCLIQLCRCLELSLNSGLVLQVALGYAVNATGKEFDFLKARLELGLQFHEALIDKKIPSFLIQFVKVGEASGKLASMLGQAADAFETELYRSLDRVSTLFEPLIILLLGVLIGGLVISMYLPIFNLGSTI